jgi:hypothetical protein
VANVPRREFVADLLCEQENKKNYLPNFLSTEKYAFEKLKNQRIRLVGKALKT